MPEENKNQGGAQNKLGELFVKFSTKGLPSLLKNLNSVQANFLLSKKAAEEFIKPIVNMSQKATQGVTGLAKLNAVTGLTIKQLNELQIWSQLNNVSFDELIGNVKALQQNLLEISMGRGNIKGFSLLGLDPRQLDYKKPLEAWGKLRERILQVDEATAALALTELGFSENMRYAMIQQNNEYDRRLLLTDKEADALQKQQGLWNKLSATWNSAQTKFIANQRWINTLLEDTTKWLEGQHPILVRLSKSIDWFYNSYIPNSAKSLVNVRNLFKPEVLKRDEPAAITYSKRLADFLKTAICLDAAIISDFMQYQKEPVQQIITKPSTPVKNTKNLNPFQLEVIPDNELPIGNGVDPNNILPPKPDIASASTSANAQISVTQYITGENAELIAQRSADKIEDTLTTLTVQNTWMV
jgi:hypothetical protein